MKSKTEKSVETELLEATGAKRQGAAEDEQTYLARLYRAADELEDEDWGELSEEAKSWLNDAGSAIKDEREVAALPVAEEEEGSSTPPEEEDEEENPDEDDEDEEEEAPPRKATLRKEKKPKREEEEASVDEDDEEPEKEPVVAKRRPGRPKGSRNKPKVEEPAEATEETAEESEGEEEREPKPAKVKREKPAKKPRRSGWGTGGAMKLMRAAVADNPHLTTKEVHTLALQKGFQVTERTAGIARESALKMREIFEEKGLLKVS